MDFYETGSAFPRKAIELQHQTYKDNIDEYIFFRHSHELTGGYKANNQTFQQYQDIPDIPELSYLVPHAREDSRDFSRRVLMSSPPGLIRIGISKLIGVLTQQEPDRTKYPDKLKDWMDAVDVKKRPYRLFVTSEILPLMIRYGFVFVFPHRRKSQGPTAANANNPIVLDIVNPENVAAWSCDDVGNFEWLRITEEITNDIEIDSEKQDTTKLHWYLTKLGWFCVSEKSEGVINSSEYPVIDHGYWKNKKAPLDYVPIAIWELNGHNSPLKSAAYSQVKYFRLESAMTELEEETAFSQPWIPSHDSPQEVSKQIKGTHSFGTFDPESKHTPMILSPDPGPFDHYMKRLDSVRDETLQPFGVRSTTRASSGIGLAHEQEDAVNLYRDFAKACSLGEFQTMQIVADLMGIKLDLSQRVSWNTEFSMLSKTEQMDNLDRFKGLAPGQGYEREIIKQAGMINLSGMSASDHDAAIKEWDKEQSALEDEYAEAHDDQGTPEVPMDDEPNNPIKGAKELSPVQSKGGFDAK